MIQKEKLICLSYSAGVQSHCILEMLLRGDIQQPKNLLILNADPGMENSDSYLFVEKSKKRCLEKNIPFLTARGPNLFDDLVNFKQKGLKRLDHPPLWTKKKNGQRGRLKQCCTRFYKIEAMHRALRQYLNEKFNISLITRNPGRYVEVEMWIGFSLDESYRCKNSLMKFVNFKYPLIDLKLNKEDIEKYYLLNGIEKPPRSVCNACFANGLSFFEDMYRNRPDDWDQAVLVDESIRDLSSVGIKEECYVSSSLIPLKDLPGLNFKKFDGDYHNFKCNAGVCYQ